MVLAVVVVLVAVGLIAGIQYGLGKLGSDGKDQARAPAVATAPLEIRAVEPGRALTGEVACPRPDGTSPRTTRFAKLPPMCIDPSRTYIATVATTKGTFEITLDPRRAPLTVNNFVVLARYHFYDGIPFHRIIPGFVVQVGDPLANGRGGPGYTFPDELPTAGEYKLGSVAMANSGPNTNGSQFFVVTGPAGVSLPPSYSLFGEVTRGFEVVKAIEAVGSPSGRPTDVVTITEVRVGP